jgi:hypothetical protein
MDSSSSKTSQTDPCCAAATFFDSTENTESSKSSRSVPFSDEDIPIQPVDGSKSVIRQGYGREGFPLCQTVTLSDVLSFFHLENFPNATEVEVMFLFHLHFRVHVAARQLAREAQGECDRVYKSLLSACASKR